MAIFHVGDLITCTFTIKNEEGTLVDPTTVTSIVKLPNWKEDALTVTKTGVGVYKVTFEATEAGPWIVSAKCTGTYQASEPQTIQVQGVFG